jgi:putative membrane protein
MLLIRLVLRTLVGMLGLWLADKFVNGVNITGNETLLIAAVVMGLVNALVRPIVFVMTLPVTFLTLGLFLFVVNAAMFGLTAYVLKDFTVDGLWPAVLGSIVLGVVNWIGQAVIGPHEQKSEG